MITQSEAILVLSAGSSSLSFSLYNGSASSMDLISRGAIEGLGTAPQFHASDDHGATIASEALPAGQVPFDHLSAFGFLAGWLGDKYGEHMALAAVGHRITHGGRDYVEPMLINSDVIDTLQQQVMLAPPDQAYNLAAVKAVRRLQPDLLQVGCFETAFHRGRPRAAERFGLPAEFFDQGIKRWGFHGLAFESVLAAFVKLVPHVAAGRVIVCHLDEESGLCAIRAGRSVDTTTGFSMLDGPPAGSRCGSLDAGAVLFLLRRMNADQLETLLERRSGLLGVSGLSGDLRVLLASNDPRAAEAVDFFVYRILREIGALTASLGGLDALVFTGSIGMDSALIRARVCRGLAWLGLTLDAGANERHEQCISPLGRSPSVWLIPTDKEKLIATHTWRIVSMLPHRLIYPRGGRNDRAMAIH